MNFSGMCIQFIEAAGTYIFNMKATALTMAFIFAIIVVGYLLGRINVKGVTLGTAGVFIIALVAGHFEGMLTADGGAWADLASKLDNNFSFLQNLGLMLFVTSVGLIAGPTFFSNLKKNFKSYVALGFIIIMVGAGVCALMILLIPNLSVEMATGLLSGALTSTPSFSAAQGALEGSELYSEIAVGHGVAYPFGVIGVVLFVQLMPKFLKADMKKERELMRAGLPAKEDKLSGRTFIKIEKWGLAPFGIAVILGLILGSVSIPLGGGSSFNLGTTGGPLIMALIIAHFGHIGKLDMRCDEHFLGIMQELGLVFFLIGAGVDGGEGFVDTLAEYGGWLFLYGALMTLLPMIIGYILARYVFKLSLLNNLGSLTGGMTSTPALGTLINVAGTSEVASAYASTYPVALICVVLVTQFLTYIPK